MKHLPCHHLVASCTALLVSLILCACAKVEPPRTQLAMNTVCTVNAFGAGTSELYDEVFARLDQIERTFSATIPTSEVSVINQAAGQSAVRVSCDVLDVISAAKAAADVSGDAFNFVAGPLIDLWGAHAKNKTVPTASEVEAAVRLCDLRDVELAGDAIYLAKTGMKINLGGIAKGFAADQVCAILRERGVKKAIVDLGGNVCVLGEKGRGQKWSVGIKDPQNPAGQPLLRLEVLQDTSVVTSGSYERFYVAEDGKTYHHIFDCNTGYPADSGVLSATVVCASSMAADALSTAVFVLGAKRAFETRARFEQVAGEEVSLVLVCEGGAVLASESLRGSLQFVSPHEGEIQFVP